MSVDVSTCVFVHVPMHVCVPICVYVMYMSCMSVCASSKCSIKGGVLVSPAFF